MWSSRFDRLMDKLLHILRSEPDETVQRLIEAMTGDEAAVVTVIYRDDVAGRPVDWLRLVDDIFACDKIICW